MIRYTTEFTKVAVVTLMTLVTFLTTHVQITNATIVVISRTSNETVFSAEEVGIDAASAYDLTGSLVIANPPNACTAVKPPPPRNHTIIVGATKGQQLQHRETWILWTTYNYSGNDCSLSRKARQAESAGYSAIVITVSGTNDTAGVLPSFMGFDWMGIRIYTSVLGENMGNALANYAYPKNYYIEFENEPYFQLGLLVNFIFLGCIGILIVVVLLRIFHCLYMKVSTSVQERRRKRKAFLTESQLKKLPVLHWRASIPQDTCSICIENFEVGEEIRVLPCSHVFHKPCIDPWLIHSSRRCPNCKGKVIFPNEHLSDSSNSDSDSHMEDSEDEFGGNERTPLLRGHSSDNDDQIEDTRFINTLVESHNNTRPAANNSRPLRSNLVQLDESRGKEDARLVDISSDSEQISDDSFGSFQSASGGDRSKLASGECNQSASSVKSFDSDKTVVARDNVKLPSNTSISKKHETSSFGSNASFFSCLESELEQSTASSNHEFFQSFST